MRIFAGRLRTSVISSPSFKSVRTGFVTAYESKTAVGAGKLPEWLKEASVGSMVDALLKSICCWS
jgi:hypothetical protein